MNIVLLGPPGAGKGTQAAKISERRGVAHISTGELFRAAMGDGSDLGRRVKEYVDRGDLVPDAITSAVVARRLEAPDCVPGGMLDGYPRTVRQAADLDALLEARGGQVDVVLYFDVTEETAVDRLSGRRVCTKCGAGYHVQHMRPREDSRCDRCGERLVQRTDDRPETIHERLRVYGEQTSALADAYEKRGILRRLDANAGPDAVTVAALAALEAAEGGKPT